MLIRKCGKKANHKIANNGYCNTDSVDFQQKYGIVRKHILTHSNKKVNLQRE